MSSPCSLLRMTAPVQFGKHHVAPLATAFLQKFPDAQVELVLHDRNLDLIEESLDIAIRIGALADSTLLVRRVGEVRQVVVAPKIRAFLDLAASELATLRAIH
jgi:DNA-binding transcriptional LysR family regulator